MRRVIVFFCLWAIACTPFVFAQDEYMWEFNEGSGSVVTDNSGQYGATLGALADLPVIESDSPSGEAGDFSIRPIGGLRVDDSENPVLALQQGPMTTEVWVKPDQLDGWRDIFRLGSSIKAGFNGENLVFTFLAVVDINTAVPVPIDGEWHHIAYAWEPEAGVSFYLDGVLSQFVEETRLPNDFQDNFLSIGSTLTGASQFLGMMDRLRIHGAVLTEDDLDSDPANPKENLDSTIVAYGFDEGAAPFQSSTDADRPAVSINQEILENSFPTFSEDNPKGEEGDYSMSFDGDDRIMYDDNETYFFDFIDEPFTFEAWLKFKAEEQVSSRPILFAYGVGGQGGYSFSFRPAPVEKTESVEDSPSGAAGDMSIRPMSGLQAIDKDASILPGQEGPITVEAWIKPDSLDDYTDIIRIGDSIKAGFATDQLVFTFLGIVDLTAANTVVPVDGAWHHIAYAWEPGVRVSYYLDGALSETLDTGDMGRDYANSNLSIGASHTGSSPFLGLIDRLRIHNAVLDETQLDSDAANPKAPLEGDTVLSYSFNEAQPPYASDAENSLPADNRGNYLTVTTFGIVDAHSNAEIPDDGQWHHVASVFDWDGFQFLFYVDGELSDSYPYESGVNFAPENQAFLYFGCEAGGGLPYVGLLDRVRISRAVLTPNEFDYFEPVSVGNWSLY